MTNRSTTIRPFVDERFFQFGITRWIEWDMSKDGYRILLSGPSGSGKTTLATGILAKIARHLDNCSIYVLDYKHTDFTYLEGAKNYFSFDDTTTGFLKFYSIFEERLASNTIKDYLVLYIDEYQSWCLSFNSKEQKELLSKISRLMNLSRAKKIHVIVSVQKPLSELFGVGARESFSHKILLQAPSKETVNMIMPAYKDVIGISPTGVGYCTVYDLELTKIRVPFPHNVKAMHEDLFHAVNR